MIRISLNNEIIELNEPLALDAALDVWEYSGKKCAVAINGEFIPRAHYARTQLRDNDQVDVVVPVGGG